MLVLALVVVVCFLASDHRRLLPSADAHLAVAIK